MAVLRVHDAERFWKKANAQDCAPSRDNLHFDNQFSFSCQGSTFWQFPTQEIIDTWLDTLGEAEQVLQGKTLIPFWRGQSKNQGINVRRVFLEMQVFEPVAWVQGTAAAPYLEEGPLTKFADPEFGNQLNSAFGGPFNVIGFGFWFN